MTRKVRFSPFLVRGVFAGAVVLAGAAHAPAADVPFVAQPPITTTADAAQSVFAADIDGDGDLDALSGSSYDNKVAWYENTAGDGSAWTAHTITTGAIGAYAVVAADVDGDGDLDAVSASTDFWVSAVTWYENSAGNGSAWTTHTITTDAVGVVFVAVADVDGDGDLDALSASRIDNKVAWYENSAGNGSAWSTHTITTAALDAFSVFAADLDSDGDLDAISTGGDRVLWYENTTGNGSAWVTHTVVVPAGGVRSVFAADVDGDGDPDVLSASAVFGGGVCWHENTAGDGSAWTTHTLATTDGGFSVFAGDVDADGDVDVVSASAGDDKVAWYENTAGDGSTWVTHTLTTAADGAHSVFAADLDGDGDLDAVSASFFDDTVAWYRNETIHSSACFAPATGITTTASGVDSVFGGDVDGDGDVDVLSASGSGTVWHENAAGDGSSWITHSIGTLPYGAGVISAADVDGDGDLDALSTAATTPYPSTMWYENAAGNGSVWTAHTIAANFGYILSVSAADIDGDGDLDAVLGRHVYMPYSDIGWWENTAGDGTAWAPHFITGAPLPVASRAADIDGDGDLDVLFAARAGQLVAWEENTAGDGSAWTPHYISFNAFGVSSAIAADIDGDGDLDAAATSSYADWLVWYENAAGNGSAWTAHTITTAAAGATSVFGADLDGDGDVDLVVADRDAGAVTWYENAAGDGSSWTAHGLATATAGAASVFAADVDRDGRADAFSASYSADTVAWHPNRGGQFSLTGSDMAPPIAQDSDLVPMLRIDAAHLGRSGDHHLELASLGLLFEQAQGVPLTTTQANALVESLRVYRDENGNGAFDPATDTLVTSLPALALAGGVQTLKLADGDPNVEVAADAPRTFFVVAELTASASQQSPNHFRVTHLGLGPSASTAEDRDFDIPLGPACPSDTASGIVSAGQTSFAVRATKTVSGAFHEGGTIAYAVTLTNVGTSPQPDTPADELADTVPSSLTVTGADDGGNPGTVSVAGNTVRWNGSIPPSSSVAVTILATVSAGTAGSVISNQGTITYDSDGNGSGDATHPTDDPSLPGAADPTSFTPAGPLKGDLVHGSDRVFDLAASGVGVDLFGFRQEPQASYEVLVDGTTGDIGSGGSGPALDLVAADTTTVVASSTAAGAGPSRSLRFENASAGTILDQGVRVRSQGCTTSCTAEDRYRVRAWETTLGLARLNNSASQVTVLVLQNPTGASVTGNVWLRDSAGAPAASVPFTIPPRGALVLNTSAVAPGVSGSLTVSHDAPYGALRGKAVAVEPATGFAFDTPLVPRSR